MTSLLFSLILFFSVFAGAMADSQEVLNFKAEIKALSDRVRALVEKHYNMQVAIDDNRELLKYAGAAVDPIYASLNSLQANVTNYIHEHTTGRVGFKAYHLTNSTLPTTSTLVFTCTAFDYGNNYDNTTGKFVAPVAGVYVFTVSVTARGDAVTSLYLRVDAEDKVWVMTSWRKTWRGRSFQAAIPLEAGQSVFVIANGIGAEFFSPVERWCIADTFSGFLLR